MVQSSSPSLVVRVERLHALLGLVAVVGSVALAPAQVWGGVLAGVLIGALNFWLLGMVTVRLVAGATRTRMSAVGWLVLKLALLGGSLAVVVRTLQPDPLALLGALSLTPLCLVLVVLWQRGRTTPSDATLSSASVPPPGMEAH